jgi:hypothetical protein
MYEDGVSIMGRIIRLVDGRDVICLDEKESYLKLVEELVSPEIADSLRGQIEAVDEAQLYAEERVQTDCDNYEATIENMTSNLQDVSDTLLPRLRQLEKERHTAKNKMEIDSTIAAIGNILENIL